MPKIITGCVLGVLALFLLMTFVFTETSDYYSAVSDNTVLSYVSFSDRYPESSYLPKVEQRKAPLEEAYFQRKRDRNTLRSYEEFLHAYPRGRYTAEATRLRDSLLQVESDIEKYGNNVLPQGDFPYKKFWGENQKSKGKFNSDIVVQAPVGFDMVAIVREKNEQGRVVAHAFITADSTYTFSVNNGPYQLFFYIGKGWHPGKAMPDSIVGGFVRNETYSKDEPVNLYNEVISYQLSMRSKKKKYIESSRWEVFRKQ